MKGNFQVRFLEGGGLATAGFLSVKKIFYQCVCLLLTFRVRLVLARFRLPVSGIYERHII